MKTTIRDRVKQLLTERESTKDSDAMLTAFIWDNERAEQNISRENFIIKYAQGKFTSAETIVRHRRKLQELNPELRGEKYNLRITKLEAKKREEFSPKNNK